MEFQASLTKVIQVTNIAPQTTRDQMHTLFSFLGKIEDLRLYPSLRDASVHIQSRCCFVKFLEDGVLPISLHMTNTVFIDRAIIVQSFHGNDIPDELAGLEFANQAARTITGENRLPPHVSNETSVDGMIYTKDMPLYMTGLPPFPPLPGNTESKVVEEIRRTLVVMNIAPDTTAQDVMQYFGNGAGEVKYFRWCTKDAAPAPPPPEEGEEAENPPESEGRNALLEFTDYGAIIPAMRLNNTELGENEIKVYYSTQPITKPKAKSNEDSLKEIEEAMKKVKEAQSLVSATVDPLMGLIGRKDRSRSRERSTHDRDYYASSMGPGGTRGRGGRSRSRERYGRRRSRSRERYRRRSRSRERRRSRSREGRRKRSRSRRRSRSRKRSRSKSKDRKKEKDVKKKDSKNGEGDEKDVKKEDENGEKAKSRSRSRSKSKKKKSRSRSKSKKRSKRSRSREKKKKSRSRSRSKDHKKKSKKEKRSRSKETKKEVKRDYDQEEKESQEQGGKKEKTESVDMEISNSP